MWHYHHIHGLHNLRIHTVMGGWGVGTVEKRAWDQTLRDTTVQNTRNKGDAHRSRLTRCSHWARGKPENCYRIYRKRMMNEAIHRELKEMQI